MTPECVEGITDRLKETGILEWHEQYPEPVASSMSVPAFSPEHWAVMVTFADGSIFKSSGSRNFPAQWRGFRDMIECALRVPFRLR